MQWISYKKLILYLLVSIIVLALMAPYYWLIISSVMPRSEQLLWPPHFFPTRPFFDAYYQVLNKPIFKKAFINSLIIATSTSIIVIICSSFVAYCLARIPFKRKKELLAGILLITGVPFWLSAVPYFILFKALGLIDTHLAIILLLTIGRIPISCWVLYGFFKAIPMEIEEAARVEGCSRIGAIFRIFMPLAAPGIIATATYGFITAWSNFTVATIIGGPSTQILPMVVIELKGEFTYEFMVNQLCAASVLITILPIILLITTQKFFKKGLFAGAVRG